MDREIGGVKKETGLLRYLIVLVWTVAGGPFFAATCIVVSIFSRPAARRVGRVWMLLLLRLSRVALKVDGAEKLDSTKRYVFVANHQSALDIPVLYAGLNFHLSFIAKKELFMIPVFGWGMAAVGHIWIDRSNARKARASITRAINHLKKENISLVLFPEGTRSPDGTVKEFKQASFTLAIESGVQVVPVAIRDNYELLPKKAFRINPGIARLTICDPIDVTGLKITDKGELSKQVREIVRCAVEAPLP